MTTTASPHAWPASRTPLTPSIIRQFKAIVGAPFVHDASEVLKTYEADACMLFKRQPDLVVLPNTTEQVAQCVQLCHRHNLPFIARGSGTGLSGGVLPVEGGVCIGLNRMNRILQIDPINQTALVETGVINAWLNRDCKSHGLFYAPDPSSQGACTIGGNVAENAGGIHCAKYGVTTDHIVGLQIVTPQGDITWVGGPHGHAHDVNWVGLFVGSEGTFGIATQALVRLTPIPNTIKTYLATFTTLDHATDAVAAITAQGIQPAALEFMDGFTIRAVNKAFDVGFPEDADAVLLIELDGTPEDVQCEEAMLLPLLKQHHVQQLRTADNEKERLLLWKARKGAVAAYGRILPSFYLHDCVIPRSQLTHLLKTIQAIGQKYDVLIGNVFHAGDGNLHPNILFDPKDSELMKRVLQAGEEILNACLDVGGVLSGEHGIGIEKSAYMDRLFTTEELQIMQRLKHVFDPDRLANPEKIFPMRMGCGEARKGVIPPLQSTTTGESH